MKSERPRYGGARFLSFHGIVISVGSGVVSGEGSGSSMTWTSGGSGVGLSLTYNILQAAGGTISFESREGEGAEFVIELPKN